MTVITYGSSSLDNAKTRRHARRRAAAMELERIGGILEAAFGLEPEDKVEAVSKPVNRVVKAVSSAEGYGRQLQKAIGHHEPIAQKREEKQRREHMKVRNPLGQQVNARQKIRGKSIPLI